MAIVTPPPDRSPGPLALARSGRQIALYVGLVIFLFNLVGQLTTLPVQFYLKDRLRLGPQSVALFLFLAGLPTYVTFVFGYLRDRWRPRVWGDRAYLLGAGLLSALGYLSLTVGQITYARLLLTLLVIAMLGEMIWAAIQAVTAAVAQRDARTGLMSAILGLGGNGPAAVGLLVSGWFAEHVTPVRTFQLESALAGAVALLGLWRPRAVYDGLPERPPQTLGGRRALARLARHRPLWPAVLILLLWNFGLCLGTPLQFYLTDHAHMTPALNPEEYGRWLALYCLSFLPTTALYIPVSRRWALRRSLWAATCLAVLQVVPFLLIHTPASAYAVAVWAGLAGGFANGAYVDLLMRSAPEGLEGTAMMLGWAAFAASAAVTNVAGAALYAHGGFVLTVWASTLVYALMFAVLRLVPRSVTATHDAEASPAVRVPAGA